MEADIGQSKEKAFLRQKKDCQAFLSSVGTVWRQIKRCRQENTVREWAPSSCTAPESFLMAVLL